MATVLYPAPDGEEPSGDFEVRVDGQPAFVYRARVSAVPVNQVWPGYQRPLDQTELASFSYFDADGPVRVEVTCLTPGPVDSVVIRPLSYGIRPDVAGRTVSFTLERPCQVVVEVNGWHHALHLFANPPETDHPDPADPRVRAYGPGVHRAGKIVLRSGETLYVAGGAVVHGVVFAEDATDVRVLGRGILDASSVDRFGAGPMIELRRCARVRLAGLVLRDPHVWTVMPAYCEDVRMDNLKLIGLWRYNADGIDVVNSRRVLVENCFVRSFDDSLVVKGLDHSAEDGGDARQQAADTAVRDVRFRHCVVWNDWGRGLEIGAETQAPAMEHITFEDCDIVHFVHRAMDVQHGDRALVRGVRFEDIRVEEPITEGARIADRPHTPDEVGLLVELIVAATMWNKDAERGRIEGVRFKDIRVLTGLPLRTNIAGFDADHLVRDVTFENLTWPGRRVETLEAGLFTLNDYARDVRVC